MSDEATTAVLKHSRSKGAARLVLFVIASHADVEGKGARVSMDTIAKEANSSARAVQYAVSELEGELREIVIVEKGNGKGHSSLYDVSALTLMGAQSAPIRGVAKGEEVAPLQTQRAQNEAAKGANLSSKGADFSGTPLAPSKAETTYRKVSQPSVEGGRSRASPNPPPKVVPLKAESDHRRLMRELAQKTGAIPDGKAQGGAAEWLLSNGYTADECSACLDDLLSELKDSEHWRKSRVSLLTVKKEIGAWKLRGTGKADERNSTPQRRPYGKQPITRDFSKYPTRTRQG